jgi:hypothetical protein
MDEKQGVAEIDGRNGLCPAQRQSLQRYLSLLSLATRCGNLAGAHQVTNILLQELVVVVELVVLFLDRFDAMEDCDEGVLQSFGVSRCKLALDWTRVNPLTFVTHLLISSRASLPILSRSSLVLRGLIALTSFGPKLTSTGPTAELSRGTTMGPLLLRVGNGGLTGIGW